MLRRACALVPSVVVGAPRAQLTRATGALLARTFADDAAASSAAQFRLLDPALDTSSMSEPVRRIFDLSNARNADVTRAQATTVAEAFRTHDADCGSTRVQIARLSVHIDALREHVSMHPKDQHSKRGYMAKIAKRTRLLKYLKRENPADYASTLAALDLKPLRLSLIHI